MPITINGDPVDPPGDCRVSLLDLLREQLGLHGTKKGCNQGACGACTVLIEGRRVLSCLTLAVQCEGREVTTIEGLTPARGLNELQRAFIEHDGFQCGYCTPGQICSAVAVMEEVARGAPSAVTADLGAPAAFSPEELRQELRERMSGNLCRCGAYNGIIQAIEEVWTARAVQEAA